MIHKLYASKKLILKTTSPPTSKTIKVSEKIEEQQTELAEESQYTQNQTSQPK